MSQYDINWNERKIQIWCCWPGDHTITGFAHQWLYPADKHPGDDTPNHDIDCYSDTVRDTNRFLVNPGTYPDFTGRRVNRNPGPKQWSFVRPANNHDRAGWQRAELHPAD